MALGLDVSCRVALASIVDRGWHPTAAMGVFGAAAAAGKMLRLTSEQMLAAFGIAYSHAAGNRQCILDGALTKRMQAGQAASAGIFSAVLAQAGFTGARTIFGGRFGFFELYQPNGYDAAALLRDLGTAFRGEALSCKPYPWRGSLSITLTRTDGRAITVEATDPIGSPQKPLSDAQFEAKFRDCARNAVRPLSGASVDADLAAIGRLETLPDARELMAPFAG